MNDLILFLGGSIESVPAMGKAKALGYNVCVVDGDEHCPGLWWAKRYGKKWAIVSIYDKEGVWKVVKPWAVDCCVSIAADVGPTVSYVARQAGCTHIPESISRLGQNKRELKVRLKIKDAGIATPRFSDSFSDWVVIKPVDGRGSRGVFRVRYDELGKYRSLSEQHSPTKRIMVEDWVDGPQVSTESIIKDGVVLFTGMTDRFYHFLDEQSPYVIENGGIGPSIFEGSSHGLAINGLVRKVVLALGVKDGTIKCDIVLDKNNLYKPTLIECAIGRMSGGYMCSHYLPLAYGYDFLAAAFDVACGRFPNQIIKDRRHHHHVCGLYEYKESITTMKERGKFFLAIADTREEALDKAWRVGHGRFGYHINSKDWFRKISRESSTGS